MDKILMTVATARKWGGCIEQKMIEADFDKRSLYKQFLLGEEEVVSDQYMVGDMHCIEFQTCRARGKGNRTVTFLLLSSS